MNVNDFLQMIVQKFLSPNLATSTAVRAVSSKYIKPHPRSYQRRLYEAAVAPVMPKEKQSCNLAQFIEQIQKEFNEYADIELAEVKEIKRWINENGFRSMAVCQFLSVNGKNLWLAKNQLRLKGLELRPMENRIGKKLFENTAFSQLDPLWVGHNALIFGHDLESLRTIMSETEKLNFVIPLVLTFDERIFSTKEISELTKLPDLEMLRAQTAQILDQIPVQLTLSLDHHGQELSAILGNLESKSE
ncbi:hypothetical protein FO519_004510 [Halicephalobus sp. NKZ332]|nr:hypothetical protein FO519_004510 [Halicephalobus sp. NKZ332]